jgi:hypothetical protein
MCTQFLFLTIGAAVTTLLYTTLGIPVGGYLDRIYRISEFVVLIEECLLRESRLLLCERVECVV